MRGETEQKAKGKNNEWVSSRAQSISMTVSTPSPPEKGLLLAEWNGEPTVTSL